MRFLASVICAEEAEQIKTLADVIDIKNPSRGPLGPPDSSIVYEIRKIVGDKATLSVAIGDATASGDQSVSLASEMAVAGADIIKIAFAEIKYEDALKTLTALRQSIPLSVSLVAVAYADGERLGFFSPFDLPLLAQKAGADGILLDTYIKNGRSLIESLAIDKLESILSQAKNHGLMTAVAGSLDLEDIDQLTSLEPDYIGFRSAIISGKQRGDEGVDVKKVMRLKNKLSKLGPSLLS